MKNQKQDGSFWLDEGEEFGGRIIEDSGYYYIGVFGQLFGPFDTATER